VALIRDPVPPAQMSFTGSPQRAVEQIVGVLKEASPSLGREMRPPAGPVISATHASRA